MKRRDYHIGNLTIFGDSRVANVEGKPVKLSKKEYAFMYTLASFGNRPASQSDILDSMYHLRPEERPEEKIIDVFVCKIRKKFERAVPASGQYIQNEHGRGYFLKKPAVSLSA